MQFKAAVELVNLRDRLLKRHFMWLYQNLTGSAAKAIREFPHPEDLR
jgi:hypothetical protein